MSDSILRQKSYAFALTVIKVYKQVVLEQKEYVLSKQLLKSGTAIGALVREAEFAQSKPDFISKLSISLKESNETEYWILLMRDSGFINIKTSTDLLTDNKELISMLISSIKTTKNNLGK